MGADAGDSSPASSPRDAGALRAEARGALETFASRAGSARALWSSGHGADALRLSVEALVPAAEALERVAPGTLGPEEGASRRAEEAARVRDAIAAAEGVELPASDADLDDAQAALFERSTDALGVVVSRLRDASRSPGEKRRTLGARIALALVVVLVVAAAIVNAHRPVRAAAYARASGTWGGSPNYAQELAVDGDRETAWLLADHATGWTDVRFTPAITAHHIRLLNAWNPPPSDRGTKDYTLQLYSGARLLRTVDGTFPDARPPVWLVVGTGGARNVTRIRFVVRSSYRMGGGLAEMDWD